RDAERHAREQGDDGDDDQQLQEREGLGASEAGDGRGDGHLRPVSRLSLEPSLSSPDGVSALAAVWKTPSAPGFQRNTPSRPALSRTSAPFEARKATSSWPQASYS